jgi:hypothetical protein
MTWIIFMPHSVYIWVLKKFEILKETDNSGFYYATMAHSGKVESGQKDKKGIWEVSRSTSQCQISCFPIEQSVSNLVILVMFKVVSVITYLTGFFFWISVLTSLIEITS